MRKSIVRRSIRRTYNKTTIRIIVIEKKNTHKNKTVNKEKNEMDKNKANNKTDHAVR